MRAAGGVAEPREIRYKARTAAATALVALSSVVTALNYEPAMMKSTETRVAAALCVLLCCVARAASAPAPLCAGAAEDDPRAARFCQALNTFLELYAEAAGEQVPEYQALVRDYPQLLDTGMKRQDVVHSFLRFGRRR